MLELMGRESLYFCAAMALVIIILFLKIRRSNGRIEETKKEEEHYSFVNQEDAETLREPTKDIPQEINHCERFKKSLSDLIGSGEDKKSSFYKAYEEIDGEIDLSDALEEAIFLDYKKEDLIRIMFEKGSSFSDIVQFVDIHYSLGKEEIMKIFKLILPKDSMEEKAGEIVEALNEIFDVNEENVQSLLEGISLSTINIAKIMKDNLSIGIRKIMTTLNITNEESMVTLLCDMEIPYEDEDEYSSIRDEDDGVSFEIVAKVMKKNGKSTEEILNMEQNFEDFYPEDLGEKFKSLIAVGFTEKEILDGLVKTNFVDTDDWESLIDPLYGAGVSIESIVDMIYTSTEEINMKDIYENLNTGEVDIEIQIEILYKLLCKTRESVPA